MLFDVLEERRTAAELAEAPVPLSVCGHEFFVEPFGFGKYRYRLAHPAGLVGVTTSVHLPPLRVQPRAEFLHGAGPAGTLDFFDGVGQFLAGGPVYWGLSRMDLFVDLQGWDLVGDDRHRFVCRAERRDLHEHGAVFGGFEFGRRTTKTVCMRIYDKSRQVDDKGLDWWPVIWGDPVGLVASGASSRGRAGTPGAGRVRRRHPDRGARAGGVDVGERHRELAHLPSAERRTRRVHAGRSLRSGRRSSGRRFAATPSVSIGFGRCGAREELRKLLPTLVGYSAGVGALVGTDDIDTTMAAISPVGPPLMRSDVV